MFNPRQKRATPRHDPADKGQHVGSTFPFRSKAPDDFRAGFEVLHRLIESRVIDRLDEIFQHIRRIDECAGENSAPRRRAIRLPEVLNILGISKSTLYSRLSTASPYYDEAMPRPFKLGNNSHAERAPSLWWEDEVIAYLELRAAVGRCS